MTGAPTVACPDCDGTIPAGCHRCARRGLRRAQLVLTVANLDTGAVASREVLPGTLEPRPQPAGGWVVDLTPRVRELAAEAGVAVTVDPVVVPVPTGWRPDLPAAERQEWAARALAGAARPAWRVWVGRSTAPPPVDPAQRLVRLCALADLLLLDLVVEARRHGDTLRWAVRYEMPGSPVRGLPSEPGYADLAAALVGTDVADALTGLGERGRHAPARLLRPDPLRASAPAATISVARVARRVRADCAGRVGGGRPPGAQAVWRDGRWWHTALRPDAPAHDDPVGRPTGLRRDRPQQPDGPGRGTTPRPDGVSSDRPRRPDGAHRGGTPLHRAAEPPDPPWLGEPVPSRPCPTCRPARRPVASVLPCATCAGTGRVHRAALITLTDLRCRVVHLAWRAGTPEPVSTASVRPGGRSVVRLPDRYRLGAWATVFGVRPEDLAEADGGHALPPDVRDGYVALPWAGADPVGEQVAAVGPALPAARLLVTAVRPEAPPLAELLRLAYGLDLALLVNVLDLRRHPVAPLRTHGVLWSVDLRPPATPVRPDDLPDRPSLAAAVAHCVECLDVTLPQTVPADPRTPVPVPRSTSRPLPPDPVPGLRRLAARHHGRPLSVRFTRAGRTVHGHDDDGPCLIAEDDDLRVPRLT
ncbi:hypothetical protein AB0K25_14285 [Micromonospora sp. NPDC049257]|uniref:hypothetical protein n=1 Tax=Micromonospora sp. NPDC049257 TaxID=3155771 RepID=UPI00343B2617